MELKDYIIYEKDNLITALLKIEKNKKGFLIVLNDNQVCCGTLSDGDIRRSIIANSDINEIVGNVSTKKFVYVTKDDQFEKIIRLFKDNKINFLPILNSANKLVNVITKRNMHLLLLKNIEYTYDYNFINMQDEEIENEIFYRPWGIYRTTLLNKYSQSKLLVVYPLSELSLQEHKKRDEHWIIMHGNGKLIIGELEKKITRGDYIFIPRGCKHQLINTDNTEKLMVTEVQIGEYFGEDDIIRYSDIYGRI